MTKRRTTIVAILAVIAVLFSAVAFSACKNNTPEVTPPDDKPATVYTVTFESDSQTVATVKVEDGKTVAIKDVPSDPVKSGYVFDGWFNGDTEFDRHTAVTANVKYAAKWTKLYTVRFVDGEEVIKSISVRDGEKLNSSDVPSNPVKSGFVFEGWFNGSAEFDATAAIKADVTYTAKWEGLVTVRFMNGSTTVKLVSVVKGEKLADKDIPADILVDGMCFDGWFVGEEEFDKTAAITEDTVVTAKWTKIYLVKFIVDDSVVKFATVKDGEKLTAEDLPSDLTSYGTFKGWFSGDKEFDPNAAVKGNVAYTAKFVEITEDYLGTWRGESVDENYNSVPVVVVVEDRNIYFAVGDAELVVATDITFDEEFATYNFEINGVGYTFGPWLNSYVITNDDLTVSAKLSKVLDTAFGTSKELVGTFKTESDIEIVINSTFVLIDGEAGLEFNYDEYYGYSFYLDGSSCSIYFDSYTGEWVLDLDDIIDTIIVPDPEAKEVAEAFKGIWSGTYEDYYGKNVFFMKVTDDSKVYVYTNGYGYEEAGIVIESSDNSFVLWTMNETITVTLNKDGSIGYKSSSDYGLDVELTKGIMLAFEYNYQIVYTAKLKDGKIDLDTFGLEDPEIADGFVFAGWFDQLDATKAFDDTATYTDCAIFSGSAVRTHYVVTYTNGDSSVKKLVPVENAKLTAELIGNAPTYSDGSVFIGWYDKNGVKAEAGLAVTKDVEFTALSVKESDYYGAWILENKYVMVIIGEDGKASATSSNIYARNVAYTFNTKTGAIEFSKKNGMTTDGWSVIMTPKGVSLTETYYDMDYEKCEDTYALSALNGSSKVPAATYKADKNSVHIVVKEGGIITTFNGSEVFGFITGSSSLTIKYKTNASSSWTTVSSVAYTSKNGLNYLRLGKFTDDPAVYFEDSTVTQWYNSEDRLYLYRHESEGASLYVVRTGDDKYGFVSTKDLSVEEGKIITFTYELYNGTTPKKAYTAVYQVSGTSLVKAGAEKGDYKCGDISLVLDGFGAAKIGSSEYTYFVNGAGIVILDNGDGYKLNSEESTAEKLVSDGKAGSYTQYGNEKYTLVIDGFGGATVTYKSSYGSPSVYAGSYTFAANSLTIANANYTYNKTYAIEEGGKVLVSSDGNIVFVQDGHTLTNQVEDFVGEYENGSVVVKITVSNGKATITIDGKSVGTVKVNYNGTILSYSAKDTDSTFASAYGDYTVVKNGENIVISHECKISWDDIEEEYVTEHKEVTYTKKAPSTETDGLEGTYKAGSNVITLDGKGNGTFDNGTKVDFTYSGTGNVKNVSDFGAFDDGENTFTVNADGSIQVHLSGDYGDNVYNAKFVKQADTDGLEGTYVYGSNTITLDGKGNGTYDNGTVYKFTYSGTGDKKNVSDFAGYDDGENTITKIDKGIRVHFSGSYGDDVFNQDFTKK